MNYAFSSMICLDIEHLYLLVRPKRGQGVVDRLKELLSSPVRSSIIWNAWFE